MLQEPSKFYVEVLEDTDLLIASKESIQELTVVVPAIAEMIKTVDKRTVIASQQRIHAAISLTAEERFEALAKTHPSFLQRSPQSMIASYLGITAETLSRLRKRMVYR